MKKEEIDLSQIVEDIPPWAKSAIAAIPYLGGSINSLLGDYQTKRKLARLEELINALVDKLNEKDKEYIRNDEFLDIFEETVHKVITERSEEKRNAYKNILINSCQMKISYDDLEDKLDILEKFRSKHIQLLSIFYAPNNYKSDIENSKKTLFDIPEEFVNISSTDSINTILQKILYEWSGERIYDSVLFLVGERLISRIVDQRYYQSIDRERGIKLLENKITPKGLEFCKYIMK